MSRWRRLRIWFWLLVEALLCRAYMTFVGVGDLFRRFDKDMTSFVWPTDSWRGLPDD